MDFDKDFRRKRFLSFIIVLGNAFFAGCEYVVILPTIWSYLQSLEVTEEYWLGFAISSYSFAAAIGGVVGGRLADKYIQHTKAIVLACIVLRSLGNFLYFLGFNLWSILCGRMLCGLGAASGTALAAEVCRTTTNEERKKFISISTAAFQIAILIGPALQFFLSYFDFNIFGLEVHPLNAPGLFMTALWLLFWPATVFMLFNLTEELRVTKGRVGLSGGQKSALERFTESGKPVENGAGVYKEMSGIYKQYLKEFVTDTYVVLMSLFFAVYFSVMAFETVIPVITQDYFGFGVKRISLVYMAGGIESLAALMGMAFVGKYVRESTLLVVGWVLVFAAQVWMIIVMPNFEYGNPTHMVYFLVGIFLIYLGSPILNVSNAALSSKVLSNETQGLGQGLRRVIAYIGLIFGPSWAGSTVRMPYIFLGVAIALMFINGVMLLFSFKNLREAEDQISESDKEGTSCDDESTPLLRSSA